VEIAKLSDFTVVLLNNESLSIFCSMTASESFRWEAVPEPESQRSHSAPDLKL
jgi:hypothetical protein